MSKVALQWIGGDSKLFVTRDSYGHSIVTGSWSDKGDEWQEWKGIKSSDLLLMSLVSCSSYDVVLILERQRQQLTKMYVEVEAENADEAPYQFTKIHLHFIMEGVDLDEGKVARAIKLSDEKYCSVSATVRGVSELTHSFEIK